MTNHPVDALMALAEHGLRCDMNPTHDMSSLDASEAFWHGYLRMLDANIRQLATNALEDASERPKSCPHSTSPLRYCCPCPVSPCPMEVEAAQGIKSSSPEFPNTSQGEQGFEVTQEDAEAIMRSGVFDAPSSPQVAVADHDLPDALTDEWQCEMVAHGKWKDDREVVMCAASDPDQFGLYKCDRAPPSAPKPADDEPLFTASMYGTAAAADKARAEWLAAKAEPQWQPIETGPHTGESVLLWQPWKSGRNCTIIGHYANGWVHPDCEEMTPEPTHWQPLPKAPRADRIAAVLANGEEEG